MTGTLRAACVIGWPVEHSRSPLIHNYWLKQYGIAGAYRREAVPPEEFAAFIGSLAARGYVGANVTLPHKEAALALSQPDARALAVGAANTLWLDAGVLRSTNTDVEGFLDNLDACAPHWDRSPGKAVVLGAGGAARAVIYGLVTRGVEQIVLINRTQGRAEALRQQFGARVQIVRWEELNAALGDAALLVNTTTLGMQGQPALAGRSGAAARITPSSPISSMCRCARRSSPPHRPALCAPPMGSACCCIRPCAALRCGSARRPR